MRKELAGFLLPPRNVRFTQFTLIAAREAIMITGSVNKVRTRPPTSGAERGNDIQLMKTARPSSPKTIDGTAARLLIFTSIRSDQRFLGANSSR